MRLFRTETRDFTDLEIATTKLDLGQVYLDVSKKLFSDDFAADLRKLERSAECTVCPENTRCAGAYTPSQEDAFSRDDARVLEHLAGLEGRVLDLGCGEGRYLATLAPRMASGAVTYVGLDPDQRRIDLLRGRFPAARFECASAEALPDTLDAFDHVLVLRSFNHFSDPRAALERATSRLAKDGSLLVVDNVAFGLVRSADTARRAEASALGGFEHYRNDGADDALARLAGLPLSLEERRDVGPGTSNQWLLRFRKLSVS